MKQTHIVLDTDILNEMDDQFALAYLIAELKSNPTLCLDAITIAPFDSSHYLRTDTQSAMQQAKQEVQKIQNLCAFYCPVLLGSAQYMHQTNNYNNQAVDAIINLANKHDKLVILGIGCATNIGMAVAKCPQIASKLQVVWLGGNGIGMANNKEFNLQQDILAFNTMLQQIKHVTIVPARPVSSHLFLSAEVSQKHILPLGKLGAYLHNLIVAYKKDRFGAGRRLWDVGVIYEYCNRETNLQQNNVLSHRCPIEYDVKRGVQADDACNYKFDCHTNSTTFVTYLDTEQVLHSMICSLQKLHIEGE